MKTHRTRFVTVLALSSIVLAGCGGGGADAASERSVAEPGFQAEVRWTEHGLPHVKAQDYAGLGYGYGHAVARNRLCLLADRVITLRGERSARFGADAEGLSGFMDLPNPDSDLFYRVHLSDAEVETAWSGLSAQARSLAEGYAAGFNRYVRDLPEDARRTVCEGIALPEMQAADVLRATMQIGLWEGFTVAPFAVSSDWDALEAAVPASGVAAARDGEAQPVGGASNAWAYGAEVSGTGSAIVVGNPHTFWQNHWLLMHQMHLTIPGEIDVMGADFIGLPVPMVGFNRDVAWSMEAPSTVTYPMLVALEVELQPSPSYVVDGQTRTLERRQVEIEVLQADGTVAKQSHAFPYSHLGRLYRLPAAPGRPAGWYAVTSPNRGNALGIDQMLAVSRARDIGELERAIADHRGITAHIIAGDRHGEALYIESGPLLDADAATLRDCALEHREGRLPAALDGSRGACTLLDADGQAKLAPADRIPALTTRGIVQNANDSYAHSIFGRHNTEYSLLLGDPNAPPNPRTRMSQRQLEGYLAEGDHISVEQAIGMMFDNRSYFAETALDGVLEAACDGARGGKAEVARACEILAGWDRRYDSDSRGALLFAELWQRLARIDGLFAEDYDPRQPFRDRTIARTPVVAAAIAGAMTETVTELGALGLGGGEPWGRMLARPTKNGRVPLHGGPGSQGVLNVIGTGPLEREGYADIINGAAYMQVVTWDGERLVAQLLTVHGQSSDPDSPWRDDQLPLYASKRFFTPPFSEEEIAADPALEVLDLRE